MIAVGAVGTRSVRLWARAPGARRVLVEVEPEVGPPVRAAVTVPVAPEADHTVAFTVPDDAPGAPRLDPGRSYAVRVLTDAGDLVGEGRFRTAREPGDGRIAFAVASCHQPFDGDGRLVPDSVRMLEGARAALDAHDVDFVLLVGDQIYVDHPAGRSLFGSFFERVAPAGRRSILECSREEVRRLYHDRYRTFFGVEALRALLARFPCLPMIDDHEIRDNFGSAPEHSEPRWRALREGARDAFYDYQAARVLPREAAARSFHYGFVSGPVAVFLMDLRSQRRTDERSMHVYDDDQLEALAAFLAANRAAPVLALVVPIPIADLESWVTNLLVKVVGEGTDVADRWSNPKALRDRDCLLRTLRLHAREFPAQRVVLLGGDIHVGSLLRIEWKDGTTAFEQLTSSALTNKQPRLAQWAAEQVPRTLSGIEVGDAMEASIALVSAPDGRGENPYGDLNLGIVEVHADGGTRVRYRLIGPPGEDGAPSVVFDSGWC